MDVNPHSLLQYWRDCIQTIVGWLRNRSHVLSLVEQSTQRRFCVNFIRYFVEKASLILSQKS